MADNDSRVPSVCDCDALSFPAVEDPQLQLAFAAQDSPGADGTSSHQNSLRVYRDSLLRGPWGPQGPTILPSTTGATGDIAVM